MNEAKKLLREKVKKASNELTDEYIKTSDAKIAERLLSVPEYENAKNIFCYVSVGTEPNTYAIIKDALSRGKAIAVPLSYPGGIMTAKYIDSLSELNPGAFNIPEPPVNSAEAEKESFDLIVVPALCFDSEGNRLGHGGGYYDRFLPGTSGVKVGLCRQKLMLCEVPREEHDIKVDILITENKTARLR